MEMENYIGEIIGAAAVIVAALIGLFARKDSRNKQVAKNIKNSKVNQVNGSITIKGKENSETKSDRGN